MKRSKGKKGMRRKLEDGSMRNDPPADSIKEQPQPGLVANPDHFPPDDLPSHSKVELKRIIDDPRPTQDQVDALHADLERRVRKIIWSRDRPDHAARNASVTDEIMIAGLSKEGALAKVGAQARINQSERAKKPRVKVVSDDGESVAEIICKLALSGEQEDSAKQLWTRFHGELDQRGANPHEVEHPDLDKCAYRYNFNDKSYSITFGWFANEVSRYRAKQKSR